MSENATPTATTVPAGADTTPAPQAAAPEMPTTKEGLLEAMNAAAANPQPSDTTADDSAPGLEATLDPDPNDPSVIDGEPAGDEDPTAPVGEGDDPDGLPESEPAEAYAHLDDDERRVVELVTKKGLTLHAAQQQVYGVPESQPEPEPEGPDPVAAIDENITALQTEIDALEDQDVDEFDPAARRKVNKTLREKVLALAELKADRKMAIKEKELATKSREQKSTERNQSQMAKAVDEVRGSFPDALQEGTELFTAINEEMEYLQASDSPLLKNPSYPLLVAKRVARAIGYRKPAAAAPANAAPPLKPTPPSAPVRGVRPVASGGSPIEPAAKTPEQMIAEAKAAGPEALLELMTKVGTPFSALTGKR